MHRKSKIAILSNCRRQTAEDLVRYDPAAVLLFEPRQALCVKCLISSVRPIALLLPKQEEEKSESDLPTSLYSPRFTLANPMQCAISETPQFELIVAPLLQPGFQLLSF